MPEGSLCVERVWHSCFLVLPVPALLWRSILLYLLRLTMWMTGLRGAFAPMQQTPV